MELQLNDSLINSIENQEKETEIYDSEINGLAIRVYPSGYKSFVYRFKFNGKSKRYTIGKHPQVTTPKAREIAKNLYAKVRLGINPIQEKRQRIEKQKSPIFRKLKSEYYSKYLPTLRDKTAKEYKRIIDNEFKSFNTYQLNELTKTNILKILDKKAYSDKHPTQANRMKAVLSSMLSFGVKRNLLDANIVLSIPTYSNGNIKRHRFYDESEIQLIWQYIGNMPSPTKEAFQILLLLGQRKGETLKMRWKDIDNTNKVWIIPPHIAKNKTEHHVPLSPHAYTILNSLKKKNEYVFASPVIDNKHLSHLKTQTEKIKDNSGISDFRVHDIRRTVATYLAKLGTDRTTIGKILNHKGLSGDNSVTAIYDRYNYSKEKRKALADWECYLFRIVKTKRKS